MLFRQEKQLIDAFRKNHPDSTERAFHNWFNARKSEGHFQGEPYDDVRDYFFYGSTEVSSEELKNKIIKNAHEYDFDLPNDLDDYSHKQLVDFDRRQDKAMANYHKELVRLSKISKSAPTNPSTETLKNLIDREEKSLSQLEGLGNEINRLNLAPQLQSLAANEPFYNRNERLENLKKYKKELERVEQENNNYKQLHKKAWQEAEPAPDNTITEEDLINRLSKYEGPSYGETKESDDFSSYPGLSEYRPNSDFYKSDIYNKDLDAYEEDEGSVNRSIQEFENKIARRKRAQQEKSIEELEEIEKAKKRNKEFAEKLAAAPIGDQANSSYGPAYQQTFIKSLMEEAARFGQKPYEEYQGSGIAPLTKTQKLARQLLGKNSPYSPSEEARRAELEYVLQPYLRDKVAQEAMDPYLKSASKSPEKVLDDIFGNTVHGYESTLRNQSLRDLEERILPSIKSKYYRPGLKQHGAMNADINKALEHYNRGLNESLTKGRANFMQPALQHQAQQLLAGKQSAEAATRDRTANLNAIQSLTNIRQKEINDKRDYQKILAQEGALERAYLQDIENEKMRRHEAAKEYPTKVLEFQAGIARGLPSGRTFSTVTGPNAPRPETSAGKAASMLSAALPGMAAAAMPRGHGYEAPFKKGGKVKMAEGEQTRPIDAVIQESLIDREDPIDEIKKDLHRNMMIDQLKKFQQKRQAYKDGGSVNPIQQGASQAREYAGHAQVREYINKIQNVPETPMLTRMIDAGMRGMAESGIKHWGTNVGKAYTGATDSLKEEQNQHLKRNKEIAELEYRLGQDLESRAIKEKELANAELLNKAHSDLYHAQASKLRSEGIGGARGIAGSPSISEGVAENPYRFAKNVEDRKAIRDAIKNLRKSKNIKNEISHIGSLLEKKKGEVGPIRGYIQSNPLFSPTANEIEVGTKKAILDLHQSMKNIPRSQEFMKMIETTKPSVHNFEEGNELALKLMHEGADEGRDNSIDTLKSYGFSNEDIKNIYENSYLDDETGSETFPETKRSPEMESEEFVRVIHPKTRKSGRIPARQLESALREGYQRAA